MHLNFGLSCTLVNVVVMFVGAHLSYDSRGSRTSDRRRRGAKKQVYLFFESTSCRRPFRWAPTRLTHDRRRRRVSSHFRPSHASVTQWVVLITAALCLTKLFSTIARIKFRTLFMKRKFKRSLWEEPGGKLQMAAKWCKLTRPVWPAGHGGLADGIDITVFHLYAFCSCRWAGHNSHCPLDCSVYCSTSRQHADRCRPRVISLCQEPEDHLNALVCPVCTSSQGRANRNSYCKQTLRYSDFVLRGR